MRNFPARPPGGSAYSPVMKTILAVAVAAAVALAGCGLDTATSAATAGSIKKTEIQEGQKTMQRAQEKIDAAVGQMQQRADSTDEQK